MLAAAEPAAIPALVKPTAVKIAGAATIVPIAPPAAHSGHYN